tara:strand:- start:60251 stop:60715 length:465 start_codon:yes stop_codon:yes gene_type:complete
VLEYSKEILSGRKENRHSKENVPFVTDQDLRGIEGFDPKSYLRGTLNTHHETGMEGGFAGVVALSEGEIEKLPNKERLSYGFLYDVTSSDRFAIFDKSGRMIYNRGRYLVNYKWDHPSDLGPCRSGHGNIKESDWAYWCKNNFIVIVYLDSLLT